jgi:hypothetical protein
MFVHACDHLAPDTRWLNIKINMVDDGEKKHSLLAGRIPAIGEVFYYSFSLYVLWANVPVIRRVTPNSKRVGAAFGTPVLLAWLSKSSNGS